MQLRSRVPVYVLAAAAFAIACGRWALARLDPPLVLNTTPSAPYGVYRVVPHPVTDYRRGMRVLFPVPEHVQALVEARHWLPRRAALIKEIGALPGDEVCVFDDRATINGRPIGPVFGADRAGRPLPIIRGCRILDEGEFFPISTRIERSFDGRYLGAQPMQVIKGEAQALWTF